jgi:TRAP-type C4-dicarboxylate transport system substrate-binding protein
VKCLTPPGDYALWFVYLPVLMSKKSFDHLNEAQHKALLDAGRKAEDYFFAAATGWTRSWSTPSRRLECKSNR